MTGFDAMHNAFQLAAAQPADRLLFADARPLPPPPACVHLHPFPRMLILLSGKEKVRFARGGSVQELLLRTGTILFAHPGAWVEESPLPKTGLFSMVLLDECVRFIRRAGEEKHVYHTAAIRCRALPHILKAVLAADQDDTLARQLLPPLFEALAGEFRAETACARLSRREQEWKQLQEYVTLHLACDIGRDEIAAATGLHPATVSRRIRMQSGMTLREYLNTARLNYARRLLAETELSIEEIARQSGYRYASYFIRAYRKAFGSSPGAERATAH